MLSPYRLQITAHEAWRLTCLPRLAMPFFAPIPTNMPINADGVGAPVVGSGPYYISRWEPKRAITLLPNRFYKGPRPHNVNRIEYDIGLPLTTIRLNIENNTTDCAGRRAPAGGARRAGPEVRRPEGFSGPVLRQPVGRVPLPGDEP